MDTHTKEAGQLLNICSFFAPDDIHISWFRNASEQLKPFPSLQKRIKDENEYNAILKELEEDSLIKLKDDKISIDPSVQETVRNKIAEKDIYVNTCINIMNALRFYDFPATLEAATIFFNMTKSIKSILEHNKEETTPEMANIFFSWEMDLIDGHYIP